MTGNTSKAILYIIVPCYNESEVLPLTSNMFAKKLKDMICAGEVAVGSKILFVDDGSTDATWQIIKYLHAHDPIFSGIKLSRNRGDQNAIIAGLTEAVKHCDVTVSIDADAQDDINVISDMVKKYYDGCDIVYGVRSSRANDTAFKRATAQSYYKMLKLFGVDIVYNHSDYRLLSSRAAKSLLEFKEVNLFLRGMVPLLGYKSDTVKYERRERLNGKSKYPLKKMFDFASDGITSFSGTPIRVILALGIIFTVVSLICALAAFIALLCKADLPDCTASVLSIWFLGSINLTALGLVGEYVSKTYIETKGRPRFFIEESLED